MKLSVGSRNRFRSLFRPHSLCSSSNAATQPLHGRSRLTMPLPFLAELYLNGAPAWMPEPWRLVKAGTGVQLSNSSFYPNGALAVQGLN